MCWWLSYLKIFILFLLANGICCFWEFALNDEILVESPSSSSLLPLSLSEYLLSSSVSYCKNSNFGIFFIWTIKLLLIALLLLLLLIVFCVGLLLYLIVLNGYVANIFWVFIFEAYRCFCYCCIVITWTLLSSLNYSVTSSISHYIPKLDFRLSAENGDDS